MSDDFLRGFHGVPSEAKLRSLSYLALCELLASSKSGTVKFMVLEAEKVRRDALSIQAAEGSDAKPHHAPDPTANVGNHPEHWADKFLWPTAIGIVGAVLAALILYLLRAHLGLSL